MINVGAHAAPFLTSSGLLLDKPWSQVSSLPPPRYVPSFFCIAHRVMPSFYRHHTPTAIGFSACPPGNTFPCFIYKMKKKLDVY